MSNSTTTDLSPAPLLDAFETFTGRYIDLDRELTIEADELRSMSRTIHAALVAAGLVQNERVIFCVGNGPQFVAAFFAVLSSDAAPLLVHCDTPTAELLRYAREFGAGKILTDSYDAETLGSIAEATHTVDAGHGYSLTFGAVDDSHADFVNSFPALGGVPLHPTSGTTGRPKIAIRHAVAAVAEGRQYADAMEIIAEDNLLCVVPMTHGYGYGTCMTTALLRSATVYTIRKFNPRSTARALTQHPISAFFATPAVLDLLLAARKPGDPVPRRVLSAGAPLSTRTATRFHEATGQWAMPLYGTTETGGATVAYGVAEPCMDANIGPPMPPIEAAIRPIEDADELEAGLGRVALKTPAVMAGYLRPSGVDASGIEDGWFTTGDIGYIDERGCINLAGRESEFINVFGMKVVPSEVESVIAAYPGVTDVKVYAGKHRSGSEIVKACIAAAEDFDVAALRQHCQEQLIHYKRPEMIVRLDAVPRSPLGKIIKDQLP